MRLVGNFLSMPQSPVFTQSISAEGRTEACGLVLRFHGFTAYQCVRADVGSLNCTIAVLSFCGRHVL